MNRLSKVNKEKVAQYRAVTGTSDKVAMDTLKAAGWSHDLALQQFNNAKAAGNIVPAKAPPLSPVEALYARYQDTERPELILAEGMMRLCDDLGVDPADAVMLVIAYHMKAATMCEFSRAEFLQGLAQLGITSLAVFKRKLPELRRELTEATAFRSIYSFAYAFACEKGQKCMQLETALGMWQVLLGDDYGGAPAWPLLAQWLAYLQAHHAGRAISKDTWEQLLDFVRTIKPDFSNFDPSGAWPFQIDEFVEHVQTQPAEGPAKAEVC